MEPTATDSAAGAATTDSSAGSTGAAPTGAAPIDYSPTFQQPSQPAADSSAAAPDNPDTPSPDAAAGSEPEDPREYLKKGLAEIFGAKPAAAVTEDAAAAAPAVTDAPEAQPAADSATVDDSQPDPAAEPEKPATEKPADENKFVFPKREPIPSDAEFENLFTRVPKAVKDEGLKLLTRARAGEDVVNKIGGDLMVEPMAKISQGIQSGEVQSIWSGMLEASGVEGFTNFIDTTLDVALNQILTSEPTNEGEAYLKERVTAAMNNVYAEKYGEGIDMATIDKLAKYKAGGYLNDADVDGYFSEDGAAAAENPIIQEKDQRIKELEAKLGEKTTSEADAQAEKLKVLNERFTADTNKALDTVLEENVYDGSAMSPVKTDAPHIVEAKNTAKNLLNSFVQSQVKNSPEYKKLQASFQRGEQQTALYQTKLTNLMETARIEAKEMAAKLEAAFGGKAVSRDLNLLKQAEDDNPPAEDQNQPAAFDPMTASDEEFREYLKRGIAEATAQR